MNENKESLNENPFCHSAHESNHTVCNNQLALSQTAIKIKEECANKGHACGMKRNDDSPTRPSQQTRQLAEMTKRCTTAILHCDKPGCAQFSENMTADVQYAIDKCESLGSGKQLILHGHPSAIAQDFFSAYGSPSTSFLPNMHFSALWFLNAPSEAISTSSLSAVNPLLWVLLWTTRSRPLGVRVCFANLFNFFSTAFDPRAWTMVVFWQENLGRQPQLITPENEGGDETSCPSPPKFFDDPDVLFGPSGPPEPPRPPRPPGPPGPPPGWPPAPSSAVTEKEWDMNVHRGSGYLPDLHHPSLNLFRFLWRITIIIIHH